MNLSICLITYKRPQMLAKLLESIESQEWKPANLELVIVDTDEARSARTVVESFTRKVSFEVRYDIFSRRRTIPEGRNQAVKLCRNDPILLVDDDQKMPQDCLKKLANFWSKLPPNISGAKLGVVYLLPECPAWIRESSAFRCQLPPDGEQIKGSHMATNGVLIRKKVFHQWNQPFDESWSFIGGADNAFFASAENRGEVFVSCNSTKIYEQRLEERITAKYLLNYSFRQGYCHALLNAQKKSLPQKFRQFATAVAYTVAAIFVFLFGLPLGKKTYFDRKLLLYRQLGKLWSFTGRLYEIYR